MAVAARGLETEIMPLLLLSFKSLSRFYLAKSSLVRRALVGFQIRFLLNVTA